MVLQYLIILSGDCLKVVYQMSFPWNRESRTLHKKWIPTFVGMMNKEFLLLKQPLEDINVE